MIGPAMGTGSKHCLSNPGIYEIKPMTTELETIPENSNGHNQAMTARQSAATQTAIAREAQEVQAAIIVAQKFPRDEIEAERRIMQACKRKGLAEQAMYA